MNEPIKVLIADDHPLLTAGLKLALEGWEEFAVVGIAENGKEALQLFAQTSPDLVLMDMQMPELSGAEASREIKSVSPRTRVVALTTFDDSETVRAALDAGCDGFLLKVIDQEQLRATLQTILDGMNVFDAEALEHYKRSELARGQIEFSPREKEILRCVTMGYSNKEIAERLCLQPGTVKNMVSLLLNKTFCISRTDLARYAMEHKLV